MTWSEMLANGEQVKSLYGAEVPELRGVRIRSINVNWIGSEIVLRVDLPRFPDQVPEEWREAGADTVQCHIKFLVAADVVLDDWNPPGTGIGTGVA